MRKGTKKKKKLELGYEVRRVVLTSKAPTTSVARVENDGRNGEDDEEDEGDDGSDSAS